MRNGYKKLVLPGLIGIGLIVMVLILLFVPMFFKSR
jgi:hypothetical protein